MEADENVMNAVVASGSDPALVGEQVVEAIRKGDFYIFTHPEIRDAVEQRSKNLLSAYPA